MRTEKQREASRTNGKLYGGLKPRTPETLLADFKRNIVKSGGCWNWAGCRNRAGYGVMSVNGRLVRAHRYSYSVFVGPIPKGRFVCHQCDNPACVKPAHLWAGTPLHNTLDCKEKGRNRPPPKYPNVTRDQTVYIQESFVPHRNSAPAIARELGLSIGQVKYAIYDECNHHKL